MYIHIIVCILTCTFYISIYIYMQSQQAKLPSIIVLATFCVILAMGAGSCLDRFYSTYGMDQSIDRCAYRKGDQYPCGSWAHVRPIVWA